MPRSRVPSVKLILQAPADRALLAALAGYPLRAQSQALACWLQDGFLIQQGRPAQGIFPASPTGAAAGARCVRRVPLHLVRVPQLLSWLAPLGRRERGQEIRRLIALALREGARTQGVRGLGTSGAEGTAGAAGAAGAVATLVGLAVSTGRPLSTLSAWRS